MWRLVLIVRAATKNFFHDFPEILATEPDKKIIYLILLTTPTLPHFLHFETLQHYNTSTSQPFNTSTLQNLKTSKLENFKTPKLLITPLINTKPFKNMIFYYFSQKMFAITDIKGCNYAFESFISLLNVLVVVGCPWYVSIAI